MDEHGDLCEQQLFALYKSCLTNEKDELEENNLSLVCKKLHIGGFIEELKFCISKHPDKQTISFQEFRDGLLLLLQKFQGLTDKQCTLQLYHLDRYDVKKIDVLSSSNTSIMCLQKMETNVSSVGENVLIYLWGKIKVYLKNQTDSIAVQFMSHCVGIPELPKLITEYMFNRLDENCDGLISFDEFVNLFRKRKSIEDPQKRYKSHSNAVNYDLNSLDFNVYESHGTNSVQINESIINKEKIVDVSMLLSSEDLTALDNNFTEVANVICEELKKLNESLNNDVIRTHVDLLRKMLNLYQKEQCNLVLLLENMKMEKEKMRVGMLEADERANLLEQEIEDYQTQLEKTKENIQKQSEKRCIEITKELSDQLNTEREMDAVTLKSKNDQLQLLQKDNHEIKNKLANTLQDNQILETENVSLLKQIEKLKQSNNDLLTRMKILEVEHDEIQNIEAKQQDQVNFFVNRIKELQAEITLLRDHNDELSVELETSRGHGSDLRPKASSSLVYDLQLDENQDGSCASNRSFEINRSSDARALNLEIIGNKKRFDTSDYIGTDFKVLRDSIVKTVEDTLLLQNTKCVSEKCALRDGVPKLIADLQSIFLLFSSGPQFGKSIASELEMECEKRSYETSSVVKASGSISAENITTSTNIQDFDDFPDRDANRTTQNKPSSLRDYPPRKEEHITEQQKTNKERNSALNVESENIPNASSSKELCAFCTTDKKQLIERCLELEQKLDQLKEECEESEEYWAIKFEEERQRYDQDRELFEQHKQFFDRTIKTSDDNFQELFNKVKDYEQSTPLDNSKNNGRLSPIDERFHLEQQYVDLEEEFEKWKIRVEKDAFQKNAVIDNLREKLNTIKHPVTNDSSVQVPDEISSLSSNLSNYKSFGAFSIQSDTSLDPCNIKSNQTYRASEFLSFNDSNEPINREDQPDSSDPHGGGRDKYFSSPRTRSIHRDRKLQMCKNYPNVGARIKEKDKCDLEFIQMQDAQNLKRINYHCTQSNVQQHVCCIDPNVLQKLKVKLYVQERKKRQLQHYFNQQQRHIDKILQRIMTQHHAELFKLQYLLRNTQEKLQLQVETTVNQADKLASADILVKDLYIENARLMEHVKRLQERCLILSGLNMETISM